MDDNEICGICKCICIVPTILLCNHIYCYECIKDWYITINKSISNNYSHKHQCPYCRQNGGFLPLYNNDTPIYNIHFESINNTCIAITQKGTQCTYIGKYNGYCKIHILHYK
jgi:hypothetical protein